MSRVMGVQERCVDGSDRARERVLNAHAHAGLIRGPAAIFRPAGGQGRALEARVHGGGAGFRGQFNRIDADLTRSGLVIGQRRGGRSKAADRAGRSKNLVIAGLSFFDHQIAAAGGQRRDRGKPKPGGCVLSQLKSRSFFQS
jgi:hypothetical protein